MHNVKISQLRLCPALYWADFFDLSDKLINYQHIPSIRKMAFKNDKTSFVASVILSVSSEISSLEASANRKKVTECLCLRVKIKIQKNTFIYI